MYNSLNRYEIESTQLTICVFFPRIIIQNLNNRMHIYIAHSGNDDMSLRGLDKYNVIDFDCLFSGGIG